MSAGIVVFQLDRRSFVTGLFWHTLAAGKPAAVKEEVALRSLELKASHCVYLHGWYPQAGFINPSRAARRSGVASLAAAVLQAPEAKSELPANWLGAFALPGNAVWVVAVREGALAPDGDWAGPEDEARARYEALAEQGGWERVYAPAAWGVEGAIERELKSLLPRDRRGRLLAPKTARLAVARDTGRKAGKIAFVVIGVAVALGLIAYKQWVAEQDRLRFEEAARRIAAIPLKRPEPVRLEHPWPRAPHPEALIAGCEQAFATLPRSPGAWQLRSATCTSGGVEAVYDRNGSTVGQLKRALPDALLALGGDSAQARFAHVIPASESDEPLPGLRPAAERFASGAQAVGVKFTLTDVAPRATPAAVKDTPMLQDWRELAFRVEAGLPLHAMTPLFAIPGLRLTAIALKPAAAGDAYTFEGTVHVQN